MGFLAAPDNLTGMREHLVIDLEALVRVESEDLLDRAHFFSTEIGSVGLARVLQFGCWPTDDRTHPDDGRSVDICLALEDRGIHGVDIDGTVGQQIGVQGLPAVRLVALQDVLGEGDVGVALNRDVVVIVKNDEVAELLSSGGEQASDEIPSSRQPSPAMT